MLASRIIIVRLYYCPFSSAARLHKVALRMATIVEGNYDMIRRLSLADYVTLGNG